MKSEGMEMEAGQPEGSEQHEERGVEDEQRNKRKKKNVLALRTFLEQEMAHTTNLQLTAQRTVLHSQAECLKYIWMEDRVSHKTR